MHTSFRSVQNAHGLFNPAMFAPIATHPRTPPNQILSALSPVDCQKLEPFLEGVQLTAGQVLCEAGDRMHFIYFPTTASVSIMSMTTAGESCELTTTSRDGLVGFATALGSDASAHRVVVQLSGEALRMRTHDFMSVLNESALLRRLVMSHVQAQLFHMAQSVVCNRHHSIMDRLCYWLLSNTELRTSPTLPVTHEMVASLLGVRRESITQAAGKLQTEGLISTRRGQVSVDDRAALTERACECFERVKTEKKRLFEWALTHTDDEVRSISSHRLTAPLAEELHDDEEESSEKYRDLYEFAPVGFVTLDVVGRIVQTNLSAAILLGVSPSQSQDKVFSQLLEHSSQEAFQRFHQEVLSGKCRRHCDVSVINQTRQTPTRVRLQAMTDEEGQECRMVMIDLSAGQPSSTPVTPPAAYESLIMENVPFMLWIKNAQGRFVSFNHHFAEHLGVQADVNGMLVPRSAAHAHRSHALRSLHDGSLTSMSNGPMLEVCIDVDDESRWYEVSQSPIHTPDQEDLIMGCARDITDRKTLQERLRTTSVTDPLTQLYNRRFFLARMEEVYASLHAHSNPQALVVLLDVDHFKRINDQWGHAAGDQVMQQVAERVQAFFKNSDCVARLGGDEFGVLITSSQNFDEAQWIGLIQQHVSQPPFWIGQENVSLTVSVGMSSLELHDESVQTVLSRADKALRLSKVQGQQQVQASQGIFQPTAVPAIGVWS